MPTFNLHLHEPPEKKPWAGAVRISSGTVDAVDENGRPIARGILFSLDDDGSLNRCTSVNPILDLPLDKDGRILLSKDDPLSKYETSNEDEDKKPSRRGRSVPKPKPWKSAYGTNLAWAMEVNGVKFIRWDLAEYSDPNNEETGDENSPSAYGENPEIDNLPDLKEAKSVKDGLRFLGEFMAWAGLS